MAGGVFSCCVCVCCKNRLLLRLLVLVFFLSSSTKAKPTRPQHATSGVARKAAFEEKRTWVDPQLRP